MPPRRTVAAATKMKTRIFKRIESSSRCRWFRASQQTRRSTFILVEKPINTSLLRKNWQHRAMQIPSVGKMGIRFAASWWLLVILLTAATVASSASEPVFVVLKQPFKIKVRYGETRLPAGMKLQVVSIDDPAGVQVVYMGEIQTIPKDIVEFEAASTEKQNVTPRPNALAILPLSSSTSAVGPA